MSGVVTRFAPSPTGDLHLGHAYAAWFAWWHARREGGRFLLRLEDIDQARCRPVFATRIAEDLRWLGLDWDGPVAVQSARAGLYGAVLAGLVERGLVYPCFCSRADILREIAGAGAAPQGPDGAALYPGTCRDMSEDERQARLRAGFGHAWRLDCGRAGVGEVTYAEVGEGVVRGAPDAFGDVILGRRDAPGSYHLCVTHDDALQGVTLVTRGADLRPATGVQRLLQQLMGWPEPAYAHHALVTDAAGRRLAKRAGSVSLRRLREAGWSAADVLAEAGCDAR